jgi:glyoxalase family protein
LKLRGIHHITAIASDPQRNLDFYIHLLGLRLVKRTVNFDDPSSYHFYFGDRIGNPGTILTFFPWPGARRGARGSGQVVATSFQIPKESVGYWKDRFKEHHVSWEQAADRFGDEVLRFADPDGLLLELVAIEEAGKQADLSYPSAVPEPFGIRGFHAPTLQLQAAELTVELLTRVFGFEPVAEKENRRRFSVGKGSTSKQIDLVERSDAGFGHIAAGTVHHIAFRAADQAEQRQWRKKLLELGLGVTPVIDRQYFHSIYFREPGGVLFEIATDGPGFAVDEPVEELGENLKLPPQFETNRPVIEQSLPAISLPEVSRT